MYKRQNGAILTTFDPADPANKAETEALLAEIRAYAVTDAVKNVTCAAPEVFNPEGETHIVLMHYGCKRNIVRCLVTVSYTHLDVYKRQR